MVERGRSRGTAVVAKLVHDTLPAREVKGQQRCDSPAAALVPSGGNSVGRVGVDLKEPLGPGNVLQRMLAKIAQFDPGQLMVFDDAGCCV